jgi:hypothetical protein
MRHTQQCLATTESTIEHSKAHLAYLTALVERTRETILRSNALLRRPHGSELAVVTGSKSDNLEANLRIAARIVEALQAAGYICKLSPGGTVH